MPCVVLGVTHLVYACSGYDNPSGKITSTVLLWRRHSSPEVGAWGWGWKERKREGERERETETETDRQTDRSTDRKTDRQTNRQTELRPLTLGPSKTYLKDFVTIGSLIFPASYCFSKDRE